MDPDLICSGEDSSVSSKTWAPRVRFAKSTEPLSSAQDDNNAVKNDRFHANKLLNTTKVLRSKLRQNLSREGFLSTFKVRGYLALGRAVG